MPVSAVRHNAQMSWYVVSHNSVQSPCSVMILMCNETLLDSTILISTKRTEHVSLCSPVTVDSNIPHSRNGGTLLLAKLGCQRRPSYAGYQLNIVVLHLPAQQWLYTSDNFDMHFLQPTMIILTNTQHKMQLNRCQTKHARTTWLM